MSKKDEEPEITAEYLEDLHTRMNLPELEIGPCTKCGVTATLCPVGKNNALICMICAWHTRGAGKKAMQWMTDNIGKGKS